MKVRKFGRNERCWCGSGLKFKKCHFKRAEMPKTTVQEVLEQSRKAYSAKNCLHPATADCKGSIVRAHSVQRNGGLTKIARAGHVYSFFGNNVIDIEREKGLLAPKLVGVGNASTFTGLCGFHDDAVFSPIEKNSFASTQQHTFLLAYRHFCKEVFTKRSAAKMIPLIRRLDRGEPEPLQRILQDSASGFELGSSQGLRDTELIKARYDKALLASDFSDVHYYVVRFNETPDLLCCSGNFPTFDFDGNRLQNLRDFSIVPDHLAFSLLTTDNGGAAVFSWLGDNLSSEKLVRSLHKKGDFELTQALVRMCFEFFENTYLSPAWWDSLEDKATLAIRQRFTRAADVMTKRESDCLADDRIVTVHWTIGARESNLSL